MRASWSAPHIFFSNYPKAFSIKKVTRRYLVKRPKSFSVSLNLADGKWRRIRAHSSGVFAFSLSGLLLSLIVFGCRFLLFLVAQSFFSFLVTFVVHRTCKCAHKHVMRSLNFSGWWHHSRGSLPPNRWDVDSGSTLFGIMSKLSFRLDQGRGRCASYGAKGVIGVGDEILIEGIWPSSCPEWVNDWHVMNESIVSGWKGCSENWRNVR